tara:strand:- start:113 stop:463 length:351 start_codon:yes stop_codon:yes gene_type:complete
MGLDWIIEKRVYDSSIRGKRVIACLTLLGLMDSELTDKCHEDILSKSTVKSLIDLLEKGIKQIQDRTLQSFNLKLFKDDSVTDKDFFDSQIAYFTEVKESLEYALEDGEYQILSSY